MPWGSGASGSCAQISVAFHMAPLSSVKHGPLHAGLFKSKAYVFPLRNMRSFLFKVDRIGPLKTIHLKLGGKYNNAESRT